MKSLFVGILMAMVASIAGEEEPAAEKSQQSPDHFQPYRPYYYPPYRGYPITYPYPYPHGYPKPYHNFQTIARPNEGPTDQPEANSANSIEEGGVSKRLFIEPIFNLFRPRPRDPIVVNQAAPPPPVIYQAPPPPPPPIFQQAPPTIYQQPSPTIIQQAPQPSVTKLVYSQPEPSHSVIYQTQPKTELVYLNQ
ncbi:spermatophorin SP23 [Tenebrio molitor]|uniref:spermatophorin SP23 n=1 Tax=Tenebrio molitor TaxID=7067 RepID=UPI0036248502